MRSFLPQYIVENSRLSETVIVYLSYPMLENDGCEMPVLIPLCFVSISDKQEENRKIAIEYVQKLKRAEIVSTCQRSGSRIKYE